MVLWTGTTYGSPNIDYRPYMPYDSLISHELELYDLLNATNASAMNTLLDHGLCPLRLPITTDY